jgi:hypothetical protein
MPALPLITDYLPDSLPVDYAACFQAPDAQVLSFDDLIGRFANPEEVASLLDAWGWQTSAYRAFTCDAPAAGEAGLIDMSVHRFADDASAQHALRYFVEDRAAALNLVPSPAPVMGDLALALEGPTASGGDYTLYVSSGPMLVRVTGVAPSGTPTTNVLSVTQEILKTVAPLESS